MPQYVISHDHRKMCLLAGLYPESHGIVANNMYDPARDATFPMTANESFWWDGGEPVWVTAEKQGKSSGENRWHRSLAKQSISAAVRESDRKVTQCGFESPVRQGSCCLILPESTFSAVSLTAFVILQPP